MTNCLLHGSKSLKRTTERGGSSLRRDPATMFSFFSFSHYGTESKKQTPFRNRPYMGQENCATHKTTCRHPLVYSHFSRTNRDTKNTEPVQDTTSVVLQENTRADAANVEDSAHTRPGHCWGNQFHGKSSLPQPQGEKHLHRKDSSKLACTLQRETDNNVKRQDCTISRTDHRTTKDT